MEHNEISRIIVDTAMHVHTKLGPGLLESVYLEIMAHELRKRGLEVETQVPVPMIWENTYVSTLFSAAPRLCVR
jgi:GxxExxY protein